jgi:hypothetical protein
MSLNIFHKTGSGTGVLQKIAGHTILLDANASEMRSGEVSFPELAVDGYSVIDIVFEDPMPDTDYQVFLGDFSNMREYSITLRTTTGCKAYLTRPAAYGAGLAGTVKYIAFKPVKIDGYTELQNKVNNPDSTPTEDSLNLVTSGGVYDAIKDSGKIWRGTQEEWDALPSADRDFYDQAEISGVNNDGMVYVADKIENGNMNAVTSNAVYGAIAQIKFATISNEGAASTLGDYICSKNGKNVCVMLKGHTNGIVTNTTKLYSGFFSPLTPNDYSYLDIPFAIRNRTTNVTEMRMGYLDANGNFYTSAYTEDIASDWDIQLFFSYQTKE